MESHDDTALARQKSDVRYRMMEIEKRSAEWRSEEYRKLLEQFCGGVGQSAAQPEDGGPVNSSLSRSAPVTPSGSTPQQQVPVPPNLVAREDNDYRRSRHQGTSTELVPPRRVRRDNLSLENREVFVGAIAALCADNSLSNRSAIFGAAGLFDHRLAPLEAAWAIKTPDIPWLAFTRTFGGTLFAERPMANKVKAYVGSFLCTNKVLQPFAPRHVGEPGVILFPPGMALLEDTKETFHVLVDPSMGRRTELRYYGTYTKVHTMEVQPDEWHALPVPVSSFSTLLSWFLSHSDVAQCRSRPVALGNLQARCILRSTLGSEPSPAEIQEWLRKYSDGTVTMERNVIPNRFNSGAEKFGFEVIKCVGYDVKLAKLIRNNANR
ncbi:hypothetical protein EDB92DRAFT_1836337 [Lactarius akahatsu]|uniref:DUF6697 domain-containing protein n=1 Tax=Lactarius akahatsu TaxID=416441 RepID=A0AAD4QBQ1_9AGAM|nr:hypothetical protein EDB92DRAFT_1836337 [Lactarius akahatsu]